jgi:hypothetical protein
MCHYSRAYCKVCHHTIHLSPVNCGNGMAVLGPSGMTIECVSMNASGF